MKPNVWNLQEGPDAAQIPADQFGAFEFARQPCSDLQDTGTLAAVLVHLSRQGCFVVSEFS